MTPILDLSIPDDKVNILLQQGLTLLQQGSRNKARILLQEAVNLYPEKAVLHLYLGYCLTYLNQTEKAQSHFIFSLCLDPNLGDGWLYLGGVYNGLGCKKEGKIYLERAVVINPLSGIAWFNLCKSRRFTKEDPFWLPLMALESFVKNFSEVETIPFHYSIGKILDDVGDYDLAFSHFSKANQIKRRVIAYDEKNALDLFDRIKTSFCETMIAREPLETEFNPSLSPLFVIGMPRSGTSLVAQILSAHPDCQNAGETTAMGVALSETSQIMEMGQFPEDSHRLTQSHYQKIGQAYLVDVQSYLSQDLSANRVIDKMPSNIYLEGLIALVFPKAKIIHVKRHPLDNCLSSYFQNFEASQNHSHDLQELGRYWSAYEGLMAHWTKILPKEMVYEISYESLVMNLDHEVKSLLAHCQLPWHEACLSYYRHPSYVHTASASEVTQAPYQRSIGRWRHYEKFLGPLRESVGA